jgi:outer membrane protein TolC
MLSMVQRNGGSIARVLVAALVLLGSPAGVVAQEAPLSLTLEDAIAQGLANSLRVAELQARREGAEAAEEGRGAAQRPALTLQAGYMRTNHVEEFVLRQIGQPIRVLYPDVPDNYRTRMDVQWPIYTAGRLDALERAARAERLAAGEDLAAARADLRLEITRAFWALVTAREAERVLERSLASIDAHVAELRSRLEQGLIPPNDVLTAEAQQAREQLTAIEAANTRAIAEADLRRLLGIEGMRSVDPKAELAPSAAPLAAHETLVGEARVARPERRALQDRTDAALARAEAAAAGSRPQVGVGAGFDYARPNPRIFPRVERWEDSWDVSVNVSWSVWDGGRTSAERAEALAASNAAKARAADFDRQLAFEVAARRLELESSRAAIAVATTGVRAAVEARRVVGERFNAGVATSTDLLDAETDVLVAELSLTRALANVRLAEARLLRAIGKG